MHVRRRTLLVIVTPVALAVGAAYVQWAVAGLPSVALPSYGPDPQGFPAWVRITHYLNFIVLGLLVRSGLQILMDHPRLYWNVHCTPGTEWARFTPVAQVPRDRRYTSKDDARYLTPWVGLPGGRHTVGLARHWHFASVVIWIVNGFVFYGLLFSSGQWRRIVPTSWDVIPEAWRVFVHYATFHLPPEPNSFYQYNALQKLAYFGAVFLLAPLSIITGPSMSPALVNRYRWYPHVPGNRQIGRSIHFLAMCAWVAFFIAHVSMVAIAGLIRNMNHIVMGTDDLRLTGVVLGAVGIGVVVAVNAFVNRASHRRPRLVQHVTKQFFTPVVKATIHETKPLCEYKKEHISPYFWANGKPPTTNEWKELSKSAFQGYRLQVGGLIDNPVELSLDDLRKMGKKTQITFHHCIQGWSGIAEWGGLPMNDLIALVRPKPEVRRVVFYSYGEGGEGGDYYDSHTMENCRHSQALLAYEMNFEPLTEEHGAPLRLRLENQLGFKMVKWIRRIDFVVDTTRVRAGEGGYNEDNEFFDTMADV
jgi:methionine sulfoxide reductase catalytic subunit